MKDYNQVVEERFNKEEENSNSIYNSTHPVGKYIGVHYYKMMDCLIQFIQNRYGNLYDISLMDIGCGTGGNLAYFNQKGFNSAKLFGSDLSSKRIEIARTNNPDFQFSVEDALNASIKQNKDIITAFDLFSHFKTHEQLSTGIKAVYNQLDKGGLFVWYDIVSVDHYSAPESADSWGFNKQQMLELAQEAGFVPVYQDELFKLFFNRYQSVYQVTRIPAPVVRFLEKVLPGSPGNRLIVFEKQ